MKKSRFYLSDEEWRVIIYALNDMRSSLIAEGRYTDAVDDTLLTVMGAKTKRLRVAREGL